MKKAFDPEKLPKSIRNKIDEIEFCGDEDFMGIVYLNGYCFDQFEHCASFENRSDLINLVKYARKETMEELEAQFEQEKLWNITLYQC